MTGGLVFGRVGGVSVLGWTVPAGVSFCEVGGIDGGGFVVLFQLSCIRTYIAEPILISSVLHGNTILDSLYM